MTAPGDSIGMRDTAADVQRRLAPYETDVADKADALTLKQGEVITVKGYRAKAEPFVAAVRMIEMPDRKQLSSADDDDGGPKQ